MIDDTDMDIEVHGFDPGKSKVTLQVTAAEDESVEWFPRSTNNPDWQDREKLFKKVCNVLI